MKNLLANINVLIKRMKSDTHYKVGKILLRNTLKISTAESCTGGLLSSRMTDISGSSAYTSINFVTYSNESKQMYLKVSENTLRKYGAVSEQCAYEMVQGLLQHTGSDIAVCTTGIAGPTGDENKPVGLLYAACAYKDRIVVKEFKLNPKLNRKNMKFMFTEQALSMVLDILNQKI